VFHSVHTTTHLSVDKSPVARAFPEFSRLYCGAVLRPSAALRAAHKL